jgi:hypothetical protein
VPPWPSLRGAVPGPYSDYLGPPCLLLKIYKISLFPTVDFNCELLLHLLCDFLYFSDSDCRQPLGRSTVSFWTVMIRQLARGRSPKLRRLQVLFSTSARNGSYEDTISNLKIGTHTRVIFQGFTGRSNASTANMAD